MNKRGLSTIVTLLILILIVIIAIGIFWNVLDKNLDEVSEKMILDPLTLDLEISRVQILSDTAVEVTVKRNVGEGEIVGISFIMYDFNSSEVIQKNVSMNELETKNFSVVLKVVNASEIYKVSIAPIFKTRKEKEVLGTIQDEKPIRSSGSRSSSSSSSTPPVTETPVVEDPVVEEEVTPNCTDGILNQDEIFTDCGGNCSDCECLENETQSCSIANGVGNQTNVCTDGKYDYLTTCILVSCDSGYHKVANSCVLDSAPSSTGAIIADHTAARDFDIIPECWLEEARNRFRVAYQHTSHGSQIPSGMDYLRSNVNSTLYAYSGSEVSNILFFRDYEMYGAGGYTASDLGHGEWDEETRAYLDISPTMNNIMWSWCGQASGYTTFSAMDSHYLSPAESIVSDYGVDLIYMTGHLEGTGPSGSLYTANNIIREHVLAVNGTLFDFADIESWDPDGNYYPDESDACSWCNT